MQMLPFLVVEGGAIHASRVVRYTIAPSLTVAPLAAVVEVEPVMPVAIFVPEHAFVPTTTRPTFGLAI
jgi:hypothetical protein